jgi:hypothetical protein
LDSKRRNSFFVPTKMNEAVPRPGVSGDEHPSRGRIPLCPHKIKHPARGF